MIYALFAVVAFVSYLIGSINFSILFSKTFGSDIRTKGSGNAGSTNMLRNYGVKAGIITLVCDFSKMAVSALITETVFVNSFPEYARCAITLAGLMCVLGHCYPIFYNFKGGKGVAVAAITALATDYRCFIIVLVTFILIVAITKYVSLGSVCSALVLTVSYALLVEFSTVQDAVSLVFIAVVSAIVILRHTENIKRLVKGEENKIAVFKR